MSTNDDNTFNNLNFVFQKDLGANQDIEINTTTTAPEIALNYDKSTIPKTFKINKDGVNWTNGTTTYNTALDRIAVVQQAFQAVELPPNATTLKINDTISVTDGVDTTTITKNSVTSTTFNGNLSGNATSATTATTATTATNVSTIVDNANITNFVPFVSSASAIDQQIKTDAQLTYNPSTNVLSASAFSGNISITDTSTTAGTYYPIFAASNSGTQPLRGDAQFTYNPSTNTLTATTFSGNLSGNATSATAAAQLGISTDATNATFYPTFVSATSGNIPPKVDTDLTYNPSTNTLTATTFSGALSGNATSATAAVSTGISQDATNATFYPTFVSDVSGNLAHKVDAGLTYNPSTNVLTCPTFAGDLSGNATSATSAGSSTTAITATNANNVQINASGTNATFYPTFVSDVSGNLPELVDAGLTYNPSTNTLTTSVFSGSLSGNAASATSLSTFNASLLNNTYYPTFSSSLTAASVGNVSSTLTYNPSTNTLTSTIFAGDLSGNATSATTATTAATATNANNMNITSDNSAGTYYIPFSKTSGTGNKALFQDDTTGPLSYNPSTSTLTATTFVGDLSGNAVTSTTATNSTNVAITSDNSAGTYYIPFSKTSGTGNKALFQDDTTTPLTYDPSTSTLTASIFVGDLSGNAVTATAATSATTATTATTATNTLITTDASNATFYPTFVSATTGNLPQKVDADLTYNPSTNTLTASTLQTNNVNLSTTGSLTTTDLKLTPTGTENNIVLRDLTSVNNAEIYPIIRPDRDFQSGFTETTTNNLIINSTGTTTLNKRITPPSSNISNLNVSYTDASLNPVINGSIQSTTTSTCAMFPDNNKLIYGTFDNTTFTKSFYLQDYSSSNFTNITALNSVPFPYIDLSNNLSIAQFVPVYYTSATDCKFFIRLASSSVIAIVTCQGDPTQSSSYTYSSQYLLSGNGTIPAGNIRANGVGGALPAIASGSTITGLRPTISIYDSVNDLFVFSNSPNIGDVTRFFYAVANVQLTHAATYNLSMINPDTGVNFTAAQTPFLSSTLGSNTIVRSFNNGNTAQLFLTATYWDSTSLAITYSPWTSNQGTNLTGGYFGNNSTMCPYILSSGGVSYIYIPWYSSSGPSLNFATYTWDRTTSGNVTFSTSKNIENVAGVITNVQYQARQYPSIRVYNLNSMELFSTNTNNFYVTDDAFTTKTTYTQTGYNTGYTFFASADQNVELFARSTINYPVHAIISAPSAENSFNRLSIFNVTQNSTLAATQYLTFDYDLSANTGTMTSLRQLTMKANPLILDASSNSLRVTNLTTTTAYQKLNIKNNIVYSSNNFFGQYINTGTQAITASTATLISLPTTVTQSGLSIASNRISLNTAGVFKIGVSMLVEESGGSGGDFYFSFTDNAGVIADSGSVFQLQGNNNTILAFAEILYTSASSSSWIEIYCYTALSGTSIISVASPNAAIAASPGIIVTLYQIE